MRERSQQEEDALRRSLSILTATAALPMLAGPPAPAQIPDPPPPHEARPATLT
jgi:hypothetical protein